MKTIFNRMRWLSAGVYLGMFIVMWFWGEDEKTKTDEKFNDIIKEQFNA